MESLVDTPIAKAMLHIDRYDAIHDKAPPVTLIFHVPWKVLNAKLAAGIPQLAGTPLRIASLTLENMVYYTAQGNNNATAVSLLAKPLLLYNSEEGATQSLPVSTVPLVAFQPDTADDTGQTNSTLCMVLHSLSTAQLLNVNADARSRLEQMVYIQYGRADNRGTVLNVRSHWHDRLAQMLLRGNNSAAVKSVQSVSYIGTSKSKHFIDEQSAALPGHSYVVHTTVMTTKDQRGKAKGQKLSGNADIMSRLFPTQVTGAEIVKEPGIMTPFGIRTYTDNERSVQNGYQWPVLERARAIVAMATGSAYQFVDPDVLARMLEEVMLYEIFNAVNDPYITLRVTFVNNENESSADKSVSVTVPIQFDTMPMTGVPDTDAFMRALYDQLNNRDSGTAPVGFNIGLAQDEETKAKTKQKNPAAAMSKDVAERNNYNMSRLRARFDDDVFMMHLRRALVEPQPNHAAYVAMFSGSTLPPWYINCANVYYQRGSGNVMPPDIERLIRKQIMAPNSNITVSIDAVAQAVLAREQYNASATPPPILPSPVPSPGKELIASSLKRARSASPPESPQDLSIQPRLVGRPPLKKARTDDTSAPKEVKSNFLLFPESYNPEGDEKESTAPSILNTNEEFPSLLMTERDWSPVDLEAFRTGEQFDDELNQEYDTLGEAFKFDEEDEKEAMRSKSSTGLTRGNNNKNIFQDDDDDDDANLPWPDEPFMHQLPLAGRTPPLGSSGSSSVSSPSSASGKSVAGGTIAVPHIVPFVTLLLERPRIEYKRARYGDLATMSTLFASQARWVMRGSKLYVEGPFAYLLAGATPSDFNYTGSWKYAAVPSPVRGEWPGLTPEFILVPSDADKQPERWSRLSGVPVAELVYNSANRLSVPIYRAAPPNRLFFNVRHVESERYVFPLPGIPLVSADATILPHSSLLIAANEIARNEKSTTQWNVMWPTWYNHRLVKLAWRIVYHTGRAPDLIVARAEPISAGHPIIDNVFAAAGMYVTVSKLARLVNAMRLSLGLEPFSIINGYSNLVYLDPFTELPVADLGYVPETAPLVYVQPILGGKPRSLGKARSRTVKRPEKI